jgi:predicted enzyme related to lactoylglutathione lyase
MITGTHAILYSDHADEVRAFFRDVLKLPSVDAGHGWLIFSLPPAELGIHPTEKGSHHELYFMCDDVHATVADLESKGVTISRPITDAGYGLLTSIRLPGGAELGLYQPKHPLAAPWPSAKKNRKFTTRKRPKSARPRKKKR